ncbi:MAG: aminotransferase class V-fold PLP-dependent enzyme [Chloroflexi bacterium]|nr:MAG: aminotransferase class V-fold PLP-dependent enzyme [Chloroflexota bacterium]TMC27989.1 MAG: aminotransferase class V-fold PLP-dependent enzyme [Chloroflexota bacterium]
MGRLWLDAKTMRELGHQVVDAIAERLVRPWDATPIIAAASPDELAARLAEPAPEDGRPFDELLRRLDRDVLPFMTRNEHPGYFAYIPGSGTWPSALGDLIASGLNMDVGSWSLSAGPSELELVVLDWFKQWIGYPSHAAGVLTSGGSAANMTALACAREAVVGAMSDRLVVYCADHAHSSVARAARILGFRPDQLRVLPVDERYRMRPDALVHAMDADIRAGREPLFVAAVAGSTSTGAVDPLREIAAICKERGVWLHVDGAYGAFAVLSERGRATLRGLELADSITLDPHKWLYQPFECGCLLVRQGHQLLNAFEIVPDYLRDAKTGVPREVNFADYGMQLSRTSHAIKVWLSVQYFGLAAFREAIDRCIDLAQHAEERIRRSDRLELVSPAALGIVCFRRRTDGSEDEAERTNAHLIRALSRGSIGFVSSTRLRGRFAVRLCVLNHTSRREDVDAVIDHFERAAVDTRAAAPAPVVRHERDARIEEGWLGAPRVDPDVVRSLPLFAELDDRDVERVARIAREVRFPAGAAIVEQWEVGREFYAIVDGTARVFKDGKEIAEMGRGDYFGELAALEWGASFSYPRLATVLATTDVRALVLPGPFFNELVRDAPSVASRIRHTVRERMARA